MIKILKGDMVQSYKNNGLDAYAHQCNCFCRMGRGIAPLLAKANPDVRKVDNATGVGDKDKLGTFTVADTEGFPLLFNVYGQYHWAKFKVAPHRNTDYEALESGLDYVKKALVATARYRGQERITLGLPLIGCGLAGGDWDGVVLPMIKKVFDNGIIDVTIFKL